MDCHRQQEAIDAACSRPRTNDGAESTLCLDLLAISFIVAIDAHVVILWQNDLPKVQVRVYGKSCRLIFEEFRSDGISINLGGSHSRNRVALAAAALAV